jgi:hypothetical protein
LPIHISNKNTNRQKIIQQKSNFVKSWKHFLSHPVVRKLSPQENELPQNAALEFSGGANPDEIAVYLRILRLARFALVTLRAFKNCQ